MNQLDESVANALHENHLHPFTTYVTYSNDYINFNVSLLIEEKCQLIKEILNNTKQIIFNNN